MTMSSLREEAANGPECRTPSPSSTSPQSSHPHHQPQQQQQQLQSSSSTSSSSSSSTRTRSPDAAETPALQNLKTELADDRPEDGKPTSEVGNATAAATRCIAGIFAGHEKLKRLLGTLVQFAMDLSPDTGDTVRTLVLGLLSGSMTAEEFHSALQEATNFPLRGFVLPYLKHTLPSLQRDLSAAARADNQSCAQYLRSNESAVLEAVGLAPAESVELFAAAHHQAYPGTRPGPNQAHPHPGYGHAAKRRASDLLYYENGAGIYDDGPPYAKRWSHHQPGHQHHPHPIHHPGTHLSSHPAHPSQQQQQQQQHHASDLAYCWYAHPLTASPAGQGGPGLPSLVQIGTGSQQQQQQQSAAGYGPPPQAVSHLGLQHAAVAHAGSGSSGVAPTQNGTSSLDDEWKNIHVMLNCILGMVEKTKRALAILQKRGCTSPGSGPTSGPQANGAQPPNPGNGPGAGQQLEASSGEGNFKRLSGEIIRATEDRVAEVKRRAEEAVQEVKRAAVAEVQRAVAVAMAESRATEHRLRSQRYLDTLSMNPAHQRNHPLNRPSPFLRFAEARTAVSTAGPTTTTAPATPATANVPGGSDDLDKDSHLNTAITPSCWNCGRPALETCGGCGIARYCGSFCQHRDWEAGGHHATCATKQQQQQHERTRRSRTPSPPSSRNPAAGDPETLQQVGSKSAAGLGAPLQQRAVK